MIDAGELERLLGASLDGAEVAARDLTGGRDHYELTIVSAAFEGLSTMERHRKVYQVLAEPLKGPLHAVVLKTYTPTEKPRG